MCVYNYRRVAFRCSSSSSSCGKRKVHNIVLLQRGGIIILYCCVCAARRPPDKPNLSGARFLFLFFLFLLLFTLSSDDGLPVPLTNSRARGRPPRRNARPARAQQHWKLATPLPADGRTGKDVRTDGRTDGRAGGERARCPFPARRARSHAHTQLAHAA